jgi:uncharacterized protein (DUF1697 family)
MTAPDTRIALFRGINIGGRHLLPMKELAALFERLGATDIRTYIQSGNVVFRPGRADAERLARQLAAEIGRSRGFEPYVLLLGLDELERAMASNPFPDAEADPRMLSLGFLESIPRSPDLDKLESLRKASERFALVGRVFYQHAPEGFARSKLAAGAERALGVQMTSRNWRTVSALRDLAGG